MITFSASSSVSPRVRSFNNCSSLILPIAASWMIAALRSRARISGIEPISAWSMMIESHWICAWHLLLPTAFGWNVWTEFPFPTDLEMIYAELSSPFKRTSMLDSAVCSPSVIRRSVTYSLEFFSISTSVSRTVESTPLICAVSSVNTEFSPT